jgi:preprotein translocase subunit YajC
MAGGLTVAVASTTQKAAAPGWATFLTSPIVPIALIFVIMMSFMNRNKKSQDKEREAMLKQLKRGDRIQTIGGVLGTVLRAEESKVEVKVDESTNTKIWFARSAIHRVVEAEKAEAK